MRTEVSLQDWSIRASGALQDDFLESVFFTGNGRMGVRGYAAGDPQPRPVQQGLFLAGMFDEIKPGITDFIHLPTPVWHSITAGDRPLIPAGPVLRTLDLSCGTLTLQYSADAPHGTVQITEERWFDPEHPALLWQRLQVESAAPETLTVDSGVYCASCNCPVPDDQVKENHETVQLMVEEEPHFSSGKLEAGWHSHVTGLGLQVRLHYAVREGRQEEPVHQPGICCGLRFTGTAAPGRPFVLDKTAVILTSRDRDPRIDPAAQPLPYDLARQQAKEHWAARWAVCDVAVDGDPDAQTALRYAAYQLICSCSARDDTVNIGARGLTHTRYKGCYFWDTDLFMMPFFLLTDPSGARSLMQYRVNCLPQAKEHAVRMNNAGARYPWMASYDGSEQCESWDIGASELHVTADVVYAMDLYARIAGDAAFAHEAEEVYIETARFWRSRYTAVPDSDRFNLLFCKGPDEYCGITSNNLFTNVMVRHNLDLALTAARRMQKEEPARFEALHLSEEELADWQALYRGIQIPRDPVTGHLRADDTFHLLEPVEASSLKQGDAASYHKVCFDRLQRYQVIKQADTLLIMTRLPDLFTAEERLDAWQDFEPKCLHDSTLSFASHALFAAQNGLTDAALHYFEKAAYLDLREVMGNTGKEGLHLACLGETWQSVVFGFAGLHFTQDGPVLTPHLPDGWNGLHFRFYWQGALYRADLHRDENGAVQAKLAPCAE